VREPLTQVKLAPQGSEAGLAAMIAEGARAMTVKVDDVVGVAGFVTPGAFVDIVAVVNPSDNGSTEGPTSKIVLQYIKVLASDRNIEKRESGEEIVSVKAVTLQVTPEQAEKLALAATEGKLQLVMRNSVDKDDVLTVGVNKRSLLSGEAGVVAAEPGLPMTKVPDPSPGPPRRRARSNNPQVAEIKPYGYGSENPKPATRRNTIEIFEGGKRRTVEFP
jgi:pilus assembly protein CpaB